LPDVLSGIFLAEGLDRGVAELPDGQITWQNDGPTIADSAVTQTQGRANEPIKKRDGIAPVAFQLL